MEYMIKKIGDKRYIYLPELEKMGLKHCFTTRDMDVGLITNPNIESLQGFIDEVFNFIQDKPEVLYNGYQEHTSNIEMIDNLDKGKINPFGRYIPSTDGLVTDMDNVALLTRFADCVPVILFDPIKRVHANIHSGWKGTLKRIVEKGVKVLVEEYGSYEKDIIATIGPAIGKDDFRVRDDVSSLFQKEFTNWNDLVRQKNEEYYLLDLQKFNQRMLLDMGIKEKNITVIDISTYERKDLCHSFRRDGKNFGLMGLFTKL